MLPTYSSDGRLHAVTKDPGRPQELTRFYFYQEASSGNIEPTYLIFLATFRSAVFE